MIDFVLEDEPRSKGRPRFSKHGHAYTPKATREAELAVELAWRESGGQVMNGPLILDCVFYLGSKRKVDCDNLGKLVADALNKRAFEDDSQLVEIHLKKVFTNKESARTHVKIYQFMGNAYETP